MLLMLVRQLLGKGADPQIENQSVTLNFLQLLLQMGLDLLEKAAFAVMQPHAGASSTGLRS